VYADGPLLVWMLSPVLGALAIAATGARRLIADADPTRAWPLAGLGFLLWAGLPFVAGGLAFACCSLALAPLAGSVFFLGLGRGDGGDDWRRDPDDPPPEPEWWDRFAADFWRYVEDQRRAPLGR
jgi:hypothetical protein